MWSLEAVGGQRDENYSRIGAVLSVKWELWDMWKVRSRWNPQPDQGNVYICPSICINHSLRITGAGACEDTQEERALPFRWQCSAGGLWVCQEGIHLGKVSIKFNLLAKRTLKWAEAEEKGDAECRGVWRLQWIPKLLMVPFLPQRPRSSVSSGMEVPHPRPSFTPYVDEAAQPQMMWVLSLRWGIAFGIVKAAS